MLITEYVGETPGVNGGYPVISGTRTPVWVLVEYARDSYDVQQIVELLPHLRGEQVQGALDYYATYPDRVDEDRAELACLVRAYGPTLAGLATSLPC